jgi:hypothetical protein
MATARKHTPPRWTLGRKPSDTVPFPSMIHELSFEPCSVRQWLASVGHDEKRVESHYEKHFT